MDVEKNTTEDNHIIQTFLPFLVVTEGEKALLDYQAQLAEAQLTLEEIAKRMMEVYCQIDGKFRELITVNPPRLGVYQEKPTTFRYRKIKSSKKRTAFLYNNKFYRCPESSVLKTSRKSHLDYLMQDLSEFVGILKNMMDVVKGQLSNAQTILDNENVLMEMAFIHQDIMKQTPLLNHIFQDVNSYLFALSTVLREEQGLYQQDDINENVSLHRKLMHDYTNLKQKRIDINVVMEKEFIFMKSITEELRKILAKITLQQLETDVSTRTAQIKQARFDRTIIENVNDYDDLEGQNPEVDIVVPEEENEIVIEENEVEHELEDDEIGQEMKGDGDSKILFVLVVVVAAIIGGVYFFMK